MKVPTTFDTGGNLEEPGKYNLLIQNGFDNDGEYGRNLSLLLKVMDGEYEGYTYFDKFKLDVSPESKDGIARGVKKMAAVMDVTGVSKKEFKDMDEVRAYWKSLQDKMSPDQVKGLIAKLQGCAFTGNVKKKSYAGKSYLEIVEYQPISNGKPEQPQAATTAGDEW